MESCVAESLPANITIDFHFTLLFATMPLYLRSYNIKATRF